MSDRLILQDLVDLLSEKKEITKKDAETFLRELIALISENIEKNEPVKIKDFGTFKLVKVNSRKSVDVNTGEAIEIPAHYKVSFTPDKSLRESVNAPFAHFESVVLEEGVTFDVKEDITPETDNTEDSVLDKKPEIVEDSAQEEIEATVHDENAVVAEHIAESNMMDNLPDDREAEIEPEAENSIDQSEDVNVQNEEDALYVKSNSKKIVIGILVALLAVLLVVGWLYKETINSYLKDKGIFEEKTVAVTTTDNPQQNQDPVATIDSLLSVLDDKDSIADMNKNQSQIQTPDTSQPSTDVVKDNVQQNNQTQPETNKATISYGDTMRKLGLKYYGHKAFWVYIYEENKSLIKDPNNVPIGTELIIPPASKYGIDANNPESVNKAKRMEEELFSRL